jgi:hypothetical protein
MVNLGEEKPTPTTPVSDDEPTIDWLIDQIAPNEGNSPLLNFNKERLKALIKQERKKWAEGLLEQLPNRKTIDNFHEYQQNTENNAFNKCLTEIKSIIKESIGE